MSEASKSVFVFGGTGFVGSQVVRCLRQDAPAKPWDEVKVLVRSEAAAAKVRALGARPVLGDVHDRDGAWRGEAARAAWIVHCAQPSSEGADPTERARMDESIAGLLDPRVVRRAVFACGSSYYGCSEPGQLVDETVSPRRPIGIGDCFEPGVADLARRGAEGLDYAAAFIGGVYGHGSWFLDMYRASIAAGRPIPMRRRPPIWPYVHVEDCARAIEHLLIVDGRKLAAQGREVIVVDDAPVPMDEFVVRVGEAMGRKPNILYMDDADLKAMLSPMAFAYLTANMAHSNARLRRLGFEPRYPRIADGVRSLGLARA